MLKGITVQLHNKKVQTGTDAFNRPIYETQTIEVENVLVTPTTNQEQAEALDLYGKRVIYTLAIPKGDTNDWKDAKVSFFGDTFQVITFDAGGIEDLIPLSWNKKVQVARYE